MLTGLYIWRLHLHVTGPLKWCYMQEMWPGGGIFPTYTLSVTNTGQVYKEDIWLCMVQANRFQQCLSQTGSGSSTEDRACLKGHSENSGISALGDLGDTVWSDPAREVRIKFLHTWLPFREVQQRSQGQWCIGLVV